MTDRPAMDSYFVDWANQSERELFPGVRIRVVAGERLMLSRVALDPGSVVPDHEHPHEQFGCVLEGEATFTVAGERRHLKAGDYYAIPGGVRHRVDVPASGAVCLDIFSPPRDEYR